MQGGIGHTEGATGPPKQQFAPPINKAPQMPKAAGKESAREGERERADARAGVTEQRRGNNTLQRKKWTCTDNPHRLPGSACQMRNEAAKAAQRQNANAEAEKDQYNAAKAAEGPKGEREGG